jgi:hypothetical protein
MKVLFQSSSTPSCPTYSPSIMAIFCREHNTSILFWNARGISNKKTEFFNYLEANNIAIALVNETHLHQSVEFKCPNYYTYRSDRQDRHGGGTAILIKKGIKHLEIVLPKLEHMEAMAIQLHINSELITLVSVYNPPGKIVERGIDLLIQTSNKLILAGDFLNNILSDHTVKTLGFLSHSDHRPVLLTIWGPLQSDERKSTYVYKEAIWEYFRSWVHNNLNSKLLL